MSTNHLMLLKLKIIFPPKIILAALYCFYFALSGNAQQSKLMPTASAVEVYKTIGEVSLNAYIFTPIKHKTEDLKPAIIFFFGGGWKNGSPTQFLKHCEYLAARGMIAITVDYRVSSRHQVKATACVADAKSAIRWARKNATRLGVDPNRIVAGGGSAGGHLAAGTATLPNLDDPNDDQTISAQPNAFALFNPATVLANIDGKFKLPLERIKSLEARMGTKPTAMSPYHHIKPGLGPTIIFHGTGDKTVPFETAELFHNELKAKGNQSTLVAFKGEPHGFFNYLKKNNGPFISTLKYLDNFLVEIGYLEALPISVVK